MPGHSGNVNIFQLTHSVHGKERALQTCLVDLYQRDLISVNDSGKIVVHRNSYQAPEKGRESAYSRVVGKGLWQRCSL